MINTHRTNIKTLPDENTIKKIYNLLNRHNIPCIDFQKNSHCTIIYSPDIININDVVLPEIELPIIGKNAHFEFFDTHDDGIVLVIEFDSFIVKDLFKYLKEKYKFSTKYDEIRPHITIQKNMLKKTKLPHINFDLYFDKIIKESI